LSFDGQSVRGKRVDHNKQESKYLRELRVAPRRFCDEVVSFCSFLAVCPSPWYDHQTSGRRSLQISFIIFVRSLYYNRVRLVVLWFTGVVCWRDLVLVPTTLAVK
jgi:hypothetical protein